MTETDHPNNGLALRLEQVTKTYDAAPKPVIALHHVTLEVPAGQALAITGPSGSGKSTLLHLLGAIDLPNSGTISVAGKDITALREPQRAAYRRQIGFVFQRFHLLPALTAVDNVTAPLLPFKVDFDKHDRARQLLRAVGLDDRATSLPAQLSGGEQQRVAIARALVNNPGLLLADEPTGNLDTRTGEEIMNLLLSLRGQYGLTLLIATHDTSLAARCDRLIRIVDGTITDDLTVTADHDPGDTLHHITRPG